MNRSTKFTSGIVLAALILAVAGCGKAKTKNNSETGSATTYSNPSPQPGGAQQGASNNGPADATGGKPSSASDSGQPSAANGQPVVGPSMPVAVPPQRPAASAIVVPAGTVLSVRLSQGINVKTVSTGESFTGSVVNPVSAGGATVIPAGSTAEGIVLRAHRRGRFKGASVLQLRLTGLEVNGQHYQIDTGSLTRSKKGKGRRTAAFIGGGSGLGMLIGGVATGGVGLLVGGLAGAGAGTAADAFTGNRDINLPAESVVSFRLSQPLHFR